MSSLSATTLEPPPAGLAHAAPENGIAARSRHAGRVNAILIVAISVIVVIPCFWHHRLQAGDLGSHVYNAWLVQLIHRGQAPGLWISAQWNNVLFDFLLSGLARYFSLDVSARIAAAIAVLIFFWGAFAFILAATRRAPWFLSPVLATVAYGWTFNRGFLNYYLALGLAFLALAIFCLTKGWKRLLVLAFVPLISLAHPLGVAWLVAACLYIAVAERLPKRLHAFLILTAIGAPAVARVYLGKHFRVESPSHSALFLSGLDQLLFTNRYAIPILMFCAICAIAFAKDVLRAQSFRNWLLLCAIPLELYL